MKKEILERLQELGADVSDLKGKSLTEDLQAIKFKNFLYDEEYLDIVGANVVSDFLEEHIDTLSTDLDEVADVVIEHFWNYHKDTPIEETYLGQTYYKGELFNPFDKFSSEYLTEWKDWFENEADLSEVREVVGDLAEPSFVNIFGSHGFPDNYYICLQDPNPDNPTVFGTDHEAFFIEIENYGTLEEFLNIMLTKEELHDQIKEYLEELAEEE